MQQIWQQPVGRFQSEPHREMFWKERTLESVCDREVGWWWSTEMIWLLAESREHHHHPQAQHITADKLNLVHQHDPILYTFSNLYTVWLWLTLLWYCDGWGCTAGCAVCSSVLIGVDHSYQGQGGSYFTNYLSMGSDSIINTQIHHFPSSAPPVSSIISNLLQYYQNDVYQY